MHVKAKRICIIRVTGKDSEEKVTLKMTFQKVMGVLAVLACSESVHIHSRVLSSQE